MLWVTWQLSNAIEKLDAMGFDPLCLDFPHIRQALFGKYFKYAQ